MRYEHHLETSKIACDWTGYILPDSMDSVDDFAEKAREVEAQVPDDYSERMQHPLHDKFYQDEFLILLNQIEESGGRMVSPDGHYTKRKILTAPEAAVEQMIKQELLFPLRVISKVPELHSMDLVLAKVVNTAYIGYVYERAIFGKIVRKATLQDARWIKNHRGFGVHSPEDEAYGLSLHEFDSSEVEKWESDDPLRRLINSLGKQD